jgi:hypothetical protein
MMSGYIEPSVFGVGRIVGVGDVMTWEVPMTADVRVLPDHTLVRTAEGRVYRLVAVDGEVREAPMTTAQRSHVLALFGG